MTFGDFILDRGARQVRRGDEVRHLGRKGFELLELLLDQRPNVVARERIRDRLWPDTFVSESTLATVMSEVRAALDEDARQPRLLRTVHGVGFAFCGQATEAPRGPSGGTRRGEPGSVALADSSLRSAAPDPPTEPATGFTLVIEDREVALRAGENVLGRAADGIVWLTSSTVSRRHARIVVDGDVVILEDLSSKNGTFLGEERIRVPTRLTDGDTFRLGRVSMQLRAQREEATKSDLS